MIFEETRGTLKAFGLPLGDRNDLPDSTKRFDDGGDFKIEIPTVNSIEAMSALLDESKRVNVRINRVTETFGMFRHTKAEIKRMVELCDQYGCELMMSTGPRAAYDTSATASTAQGRTIAYRLRGQEQLIRAIEDIKRGIDLGVAAFVIYDEGLLWLLVQMRTNGVLPKSIKFKVSAHCGHGNPAAFKMLESLGADSINAVRDLQLPMIAALREAVDIPIDCHTDNPLASGGFIRVYEAPEIVRIASPVYLKTGNSAVSVHGSIPGKKEGLRMANQAAIVLEMLERYMPEAKQSA
ncbi:MAG: peptidase [Gammaproteobacteria bacterium CG11_big_fil_rev_8_21_14_0_20_46_22]|nr:MAG: peptidase [Gammaproteobacteria bacterium CG11_big_fil_rev_8_21_14_0_20_46_22]